VEGKGEGEGVSWDSLEAEVRARDEGAMERRATAWIEGLAGRARLGWDDAREELRGRWRWETNVYAVLCQLGVGRTAARGTWLGDVQGRVRAHLVAITNARGLRVLEVGLVTGAAVPPRFVCDARWATEMDGERVRALLRWVTYHQMAVLEPAPHRSGAAAGAAAAGVDEEGDGAHVAAQGEARREGHGGDEVGVEDRALVRDHLGSELAPLGVGVAAVEPVDQVGPGRVVYPWGRDVGDAWADELTLL